MLKSEETTLAELMAEVRRLEIARGFDAQKKIKIVFDAVFADVSEPKGILERITKHKAFLAKFTDEQTAPIFISHFEEIVGILHPKLMPRTPIFLQVRCAFLLALMRQSARVHASLSQRLALVAVFFLREDSRSVFPGILVRAVHKLCYL